MSTFAAVSVEDVRNYWNRRPCNIRHSPLEAGTRDFFDEVEKRKYFVEPHIPAFAQFERWRGKRVLEIGCGIGTDTISFARAGALVTAVDFSEESLAMARRRAAVYGIDTIRFYHANAEELSSVVPLEQYDLVYSFGVIHHTPHPGRVIEQIRRYLKPDGELKIMVYNRLSWKVLWIIMTYGKGAFWKADRLVATHSEAQTGCPVTYSYTRRSVARLLEGFEIFASDVEHIFPYRIPDYIHYRYRMVWYFRMLPRAVFHWLEKVGGWHLCVTAHISHKR